MIPHFPIFEGNKPGVVACACNPNKPGGRDQEDQGSRPVWENSYEDPRGPIKN
jgi:hypothetical protein